MHEVFRKFSHHAARAVGSPWAFCCAVGIVIAWAFLGPATHFSSAWQLWINTGTTIVTFLMVFLIQNEQNRDGRVVELKLDELIRAIQDANDEMMDLEEKPDTAIEAAHRRLVEEGLGGKSAMQSPNHT